MYYVVWCSEPKLLLIVKINAKYEWLVTSDPEGSEFTKVLDKDDSQCGQRKRTKRRNRVNRVRGLNLPSQL